MRACKTWVCPFTALYTVIGVYSSLGLANTIIDNSVSCATGLSRSPECEIHKIDAELEHSGATSDYSAGNNANQTNPIWEIKQSPGKGLGVFATTLIKAGTRIMDEEPLFAISPPEMVPGKGYEVQGMISDVDSAVAALSPEQRAEFHSCHEYRLPQEEPQSHQHHQYRNMYIFRSNAYTLTDGTIAMFPRMAKINHSCRPNAASIWSDASRRKIVWAARDIAPGEEVTVTYIPLLKRHDERQERLAQYGFQCTCEACLDRENTDHSRVQMGRLLAELEDRLVRNTSAFANKKLLPKATALVGKLEEEHMMDYLGKAYQLAAEVSFRLGDVAAAEDFARKALRVHEQGDERSAATTEAREYLERIIN